MKKIPLFVFAVFLSIVLFAQQVTEESIVINVEVPVRVFKGKTFVDDLGINDFEVSEDGITQRLEAVYLVKKRNVERSEEKKRFAPKTVRDFYLFFEITEYTPKLGDAISFFIQNVLYPDDYLTVITPVKSYRMRGRALEFRSKEEVVDRLIGLLRRDALVGNSTYRSALQDLENLAKSLSVSLTTDDSILRMDDLTAGEFEALSIDEQITKYEELLSRLENLRRVNQEQLLNFAKFLKDKEGQKYIFMFYQREFIPQIDPKILSQYLSMYQDKPNVQQIISGVFEFFRRDINFDVDAVKQAFADSSISIHFLYITTPAKQTYGIRMEEKSEDIYSAFKEMARATGGFTDSSANPDSLFQQAVDASENYYLIYYSPLNYKSDGKFKEIKVRVKDKDYRVTHRLGYFAN